MAKIDEGLSYLQLGLFCQIAFRGALVMWSWLICRACWPSRHPRRDATRHFWIDRIR